MDVSKHKSPALQNLAKSKQKVEVLHQSIENLLSLSAQLSNVLHSQNAELSSGWALSPLLAVKVLQKVFKELQNVAHEL